MNAESARMTKILRRLAWHRIEREQEEAKIARSQRRKKRLDRLFALVGKSARLLKRLWDYTALYDGVPLLIALLLMFCFYLTTLAT